MLNAASNAWKRHIRSLLGGRRPPARNGGKRPPSPPRLEALEDRLAPAAFGPQDLLVVSAGGLSEYTASGALVQRLPIPDPGGRPGTEVARDVAVDVAGLAHVYKGTSDPYLSALAAAS